MCQGPNTAGDGVRCPTDSPLLHGWGMGEERPRRTQTFKLPDGKGGIERDTRGDMLGHGVMCFVGHKGWGWSLADAFA